VFIKGTGQQTTSILTLSVGIGTGGASAIAELEILLGAAGLALTGTSVYGSIEYNAFKPCEIMDGAAIYELKKGGAEQIVAVRVFEDDKYIWKVVK
jgi:hypothetical protein